VVPLPGAGPDSSPCTVGKQEESPLPEFTGRADRVGFWTRIPIRPSLSAKYRRPTMPAPRPARRVRGSPRSTPARSPPTHRPSGGVSHSAGLRRKLAVALQSGRVRQPCPNGVLCQTAMRGLRAHPHGRNSSTRLSGLSREKPLACSISAPGSVAVIRQTLPSPGATGVPAERSSLPALPRSPAGALSNWRRRLLRPRTWWAPRPTPARARCATRSTRLNAGAYNVIDFNIRDGARCGNGTCEGFSLEGPESRVELLRPCGWPAVRASLLTHTPFGHGCRTLPRL